MCKTELASPKESRAWWSLLTYSPMKPWQWIAVLQLVVALIFGGRAGAEQLYVLNGKRATLTVVDDSTLKRLGEIPLSSDPTFALLDPQKPVAYVLHSGIFTSLGKLRRGEPEVGKLEVVDLQQRKVIKEIPLGWNAQGLWLSGNGKYLYCLSNGWRYQYQQKKGRSPDPEGIVTVVNRETLEQVVKLVPGRLATQLVETKDHSRLVVLAGGSIYLDYPQNPREAEVMRAGFFSGNRTEWMDARIVIYDTARFQKLLETKLEGAPTELELSQDERYAFLLDRGLPHRKKRLMRQGTVQIVNLGSGSVEAREEAGMLPLVARWDPDGLGLDLVTHSAYGGKADLLFLHVRPNMTMQSKVLGQFGEYLGELLPFRGNNLAVTTFYARRGLVPQSHLALVDLNSSTLLCRVPIGSKGIRAAKNIGMGALAITAGFIPPVGIGFASWLLHDVGETPRRPLPENIALPRDEQVLYALDQASDRVSVVRTQDGTVVNNIPVGAGCRNLILAPGGKYVLVQGGAHFVWLSTENHQKSGEHLLGKGRIISMYPDPEGKRILLLGENFLLPWDAEKGIVGTAVTGFHFPLQVLRPQLRAGTER